MHAMNLIHPDFVSSIDSLNKGITDLLTSGFLSNSYILDKPLSQHVNMNKKLENLILAFDKPIGEIFAMMENDLRGEYKNNLPIKDQDNFKTYIYDNKMHFRNNVYDKVALIPLLMDFSNNFKEFEGVYYPLSQKTKILKYIDDTLKGFNDYNKFNKEGILEFFPLLGINTPAHSIEFIKDLLATYINNTHKINTNKLSKKKFYGVKFYPPLGLNPWPKEKKELQKMQYIYEFCVENNLPIITHCDDQGFRTIPTKEAWEYTNPKSWDIVLNEYPNLKIDFAHSGKQYNSISNLPTTSLIAQNIIKRKEDRIPTSPWFHEIIKLMKKYDNVYLDFSFSGTVPLFYSEVLNFYNLPENKEYREIFIKHSLFGSDFSINLLKAQSYSSYYKIFEESNFNDSEINHFVSKNPVEFLGI